MRLFLLVLPICVSAQLPLAWDKTLGGSRYEELNAIQALSDGIMLGGSSNTNFSFGRPGDLSWNMWLAKLDFSGQLLWEHVYGGDQDDRLWALLPTSDGGFIAGGHSYSGQSGDKTEAGRGDMDVWVIKLDRDGQLEWDRTYGGTDRDELFALLELPNQEGYLLGCHSKSNTGGEKSENSRGDQDIWILQIDGDGNVDWDKTIGGDNYDQIHDLEWAADGNVYLSGGTLSTPGTGEVSAVPALGSLDFWLVKFNLANRTVIWNRRYGGDGEDFAYALCVSRFGKLYLGGRSASAGAPPTPENHGRESAFFGGYSDYWMVELDLNGNKQREWCYGGAGLDDLYYIQENPQGQLVLGGLTDSGLSGNKTAAPRGAYDFWLIGLDADGTPSWQQTLGGAGNDALTKIALLPSGAYVFGGHSDSDMGFEKSQNSLGVNDFWVVTSECNIVPDILQQPDTDPCLDEPIVMTASATGCTDCYFQWNTGDSGPALELPAGTNGLCWVQVQDENGCQASDSLLVQPPLPPSVDLGPADTLIRQGQQLLLGRSGAGWKYRWSTGDTTATIAIEEAGSYSVTVTLPGGCTATDAIAVRVERSAAVWVPNVFSPDFDGYNDFVSIYGNASVDRIITFQVTDRWGELVFRRDNFPLPGYDNDGWDGTSRGKRLSAGVFTWYMRVAFTDGKEEFFEGNVTLVR